jgi:hypothetical protein
MPQVARADHPAGSGVVAVTAEFTVRLNVFEALE